MTRFRLLNTAAIALLSMAFLGACSTESLAERAASFGLEQAIEGDEDIDLDFSGDGGGFSISTEEGDFAINFDEENGGIVFDTEDGQGVISFDQDGIVFDTDEGDGVINFDEDGIVFDTDEGSGVVSFDEGSGVVFDTDEGTSVFGASETPDLWPAGVAVPATVVEQPFYSQLDVGTEVVVSAVFNHDPNEAYAQQLEAALLAQGWTIESEMQSTDGRWVSLARDGAIATYSSDPTGFTAVTFTFPQDQ